MASVLATTGATATTTATSATTSGFSEENFLKKLDSVQPTQDSIQSLALWIIHHKANHEIICRLWMRKLNDSNNGKQRLALFYLANDVIQNCRRKNAKIFQDTFKTCLIEAVELVRNDSIKKKIERVFDVWSERNVYEHGFIVKLTESLYKEDKISNKMSAKSPPAPKSPPPATALILAHAQPSETQHNTKNQIEYQKIIAEFQPKNLRESISSFSSLQAEVNLAKSNVEATRLLDINVDHVKQYRDKSQCSKFKIEFENSCAKLEEYINKLSDEAEKRKQLIQLLNQSEIFYDAQFKDATTVYNAYKSYGSKVSLVKRKLDELIISKFNSNDVKLDNLDMEMSEEDEDDDAKLKKAKSNYTKHSSKSSRSPPHVSTSSSASSSNGSIRNNLDPRQNRHSHHHSSSSNNKKSSSSSSSSFYKQNQSSTTKRTKSEDKDGSNTPVKDEYSPIKSSANSSSNNPLDFLTKFINKSSINSNEPGLTATSSTNTSSSSSSSANLSYLVDSLKKFVNTNATGSTTPYTETNTYIPQPTTTTQPSQYMYDPSLNSQATYIPTSQTILQQQQQQRSATPTKDEIYQPTALMPPMPPLPPPLPPLPVDTIHNQQQPGPNSPYLPPPSPYHPMMYSPSPTMYPPPPIYLQGPPPPPPPLQMQQPPPPNMPLMMIDPNNCYQYPAQPQAGTKMMISPTLSNASTNSSNSNLNQPNSPSNPNQGYWSNPTTPTGSNQFNYAHPTHLDDSFSEDNQMRLNSNTNNTKRNTNYNNDNSSSNRANNSNDYQSPYNKRNKYNSNYEDSYNGNNYNKGYSKHQQNQRIPTINSQRDRGSSYADTTSTNNNRGGANQSGRY